MSLNAKQINIIKYNKNCHDSVADRYADTHLDIFNPIEQKRISQSLATLGKFILQDSVVLDFGCGSGNLTNHLMELNYNVVSADISERFLEIVATRFHGNSRHSSYLLTGDSGLDLKDMRFDAICMYSVLHHVPDYLSCLGNLTKLLCPKGIIFIDHESSPAFWQSQPLYSEMQRRSRFKKIKNNYKKLFKFSWYVNKLKKIRNPRFQEEGDIHVWPDDHIEWDLIDSLLEKQGLIKLSTEDYLVYQNHYHPEVYKYYKNLVSDMRFSIYRMNS